MRLSPKPIFFGLITLGLPFAVTVGWTLGTPAPMTPAVSAPGGAGGIGVAPARAKSPASGRIADWSPPTTKPVAVESTLATREAVIVLPSLPATSIVVPVTPSPGLTLLPPVPTPTAIVTPPSPSATDPSESADPEVSGLSDARLVRGS
ncbi:hypothetical protein [Actinoplanes sp. NPDC026623]|uniref:hypothetical protein n=1 Tax=Actinoplanes sp. NPDC026623 TaxID=3155610 RepID=UPI0034095C37